MFKLYININCLINALILCLFTSLANMLPYLVKYLIGYCHFYYQLGYGLIFYIYIYRRRKAKRTNNWTGFYGNSVPNWVLFNISILNKFLFTKTFVTYVASHLKKFFIVTSFWINNSCKTSSSILKTITTLKNTFKKHTNFVWTPIFKRTSYISFSTFLKRFTKRK